jgi:NSS family neurotransmitter:Na+ symporter
MREYVNEVSEIRIGKWWDVCIMVITPLILGLSLILSIITLVQKGYGGYPTWATLIGIMITIGIVVLSFILMSIKGKPGLANTAGSD